MKIRSLAGLSLLLAVVVSTTGCHLRPNWFFPPGDKDTQRTRAVIYDPFPDANAGPTIEGGRPLGYQRPASETSRIQMTTNRQAPGPGY